ncbi:MAG TPA: type VII secretion protein EccE [Candidatus Limnocylindrales bacterium]
MFVKGGGPEGLGGGINLAWRIAVWQLIAVVVVAALVMGEPVVAVAGCLLLAVSAIRIDGKWLDQLVTTYLRYRSQRAHHDGTPLESLAPGLSTHAYTDRAGNRIGVAESGREWTALLRIEPPDTGSVGVLLDEVAASLSAAGEPGTKTEGVRLASAQLVRWAVPRPAKSQAKTSSKTSSKTSGKRTWDVYWVAVRFDAVTDARAVAARGGGKKGAIAATAVAALRLAIQLRQAGFTARAVEEPELRTELVCSLGGPGKVREAWRWWSVGTLHHATYRVNSSTDPAQLLSWSAPAPALSTCTAILLRSKDREVRRSVLTRIAVPADRKDRAAISSALRQATSGSRRQLKPMNGRQRAGVRSTLPLG